MHAHATHTHTSSSSCHHVLKDVGRDPGYCRRDRLSWRITAHHLERSMINSCQSVTPEKVSRLSTLHHHSGAPPGGLLLPLGRHFNPCFWMRLSGILQICPSHCRRLPQLVFHRQLSSFLKNLCVPQHVPVGDPHAGHPSSTHTCTHTLMLM